MGCLLVLSFNPGISRIAVPIMNGAHEPGCISIIWMESAIKFDEATRRYLPILRDAAARIETAYAETVSN